MNEDLIVGRPVSRSGYFSKAMFFRSQPTAEIERRIGYSPGTLSKGWWLLFMLDIPNADEFKMRGYSHMSGGVYQGHLAAPPDPRTAEKHLQDGGFDTSKMKERLIRETFTLAGANRLAKIVPNNTAQAFPAGSGIPQWELTNPKQFRVAAWIAPGETYLGHYT